MWLQHRITSRSKCANFSNNQLSSSNIGPRSPAVSEFVLSGTFAPTSLVKIFLSIKKAVNNSYRTINSLSYKFVQVLFTLYNSLYIIEFV